MNRVLLWAATTAAVLAAGVPVRATTIDFSFTNTTGFDGSPDTVMGTLTFASGNFTGGTSDVVITSVSAGGADPFNGQPNYNFTRPYDLGSSAVTNNFTLVAGVVTSYDYNSGVFDNYSGCGGTCGGFQMTLAPGDTTLQEYNSSFDSITTGGTTFTPAVSATPLPAALPLFAGGLGFVGFLARRRKGTALAA